MQRAHVRNQNGSKSRQKGRKNSRFQWKEEWKSTARELIKSGRLPMFQWKEEWKIHMSRWSYRHLPDGQVSMKRRVKAGICGEYGAEFIEVEASFNEKKSERYLHAGHHHLRDDFCFNEKKSESCSAPRRSRARPRSGFNEKKSESNSGKRMRNFDSHSSFQWKEEWKASTSALSLRRSSSLCFNEKKSESQKI